MRYVVQAPLAERIDFCQWPDALRLWNGITFPVGDQTLDDAT